MVVYWFFMLFLSCALTAAASEEGGPPSLPETAEEASQMLMGNLRFGGTVRNPHLHPPKAAVILRYYQEIAPNNNSSHKKNRIQWHHSVSEATKPLQRIIPVINFEELGCLHFYDPTDNTIKLNNVAIDYLHALNWLSLAQKYCEQAPREGSELGHEELIYELESIHYYICHSMLSGQQHLSPSARSEWLSLAFHFCEHIEKSLAKALWEHNLHYGKIPELLSIDHDKRLERSITTLQRIPEWNEEATAEDRLTFIDTIFEWFKNVRLGTIPGATRDQNATFQHEYTKLEEARLNGLYELRAVALSTERPPSLPSLESSSPEKGPHHIKSPPRSALKGARKKEAQTSQSQREASTKGPEGIKTPPAPPNPPLETPKSSSLVRSSQLSLSSPAYTLLSALGCSVAYATLIYREYHDYSVRFQNMPDEEKNSEPKKSFWRFAAQRFFKTRFSCADLARLGALASLALALYPPNFLLHSKPTEG